MSNKALFQADMQGFTGGAFAKIQGGTYGSGFLSGSMSSGFTSIGEALKLGTVPLIAYGGVMGGAGSVIGGGNFLDGFKQGIIVALLNHTVHAAVQSIMDGPVEYSDASLEKFYKKYFGNYKSVNKVHASIGIMDGPTSDGYGITPSGELAFGVTVSLGNGKSDIYMAPAAFSSKSNLYMSLGHEIIHSNLNAGGYLVNGSHIMLKQHHGVISYWESGQARTWQLSDYKYYAGKASYLGNFATQIPDYKKYWIPIKDKMPW